MQAEPEGRELRVWGVLTQLDLAGTPARTLGKQREQSKTAEHRGQGSQMMHRLGAGVNLPTSPWQ